LSRLRNNDANSKNSNKKQHKPITITAIAHPGNSRGVTGTSPKSVVAAVPVDVDVTSPSVATAGVGANVGCTRVVDSGGCVAPVVVDVVVPVVVVVRVVGAGVWPTGVGGAGVGAGVRVVVLTGSVVSVSVVGAVVVVGSGVGALVGGATGVGAGVSCAGGVNGGGLPHCASLTERSGRSSRLSMAKPLPGVADEPMATTKRSSTSLEQAYHESRGIVLGLMWYVAFTH
jgi:hypothetical protein